MTTDTDATLEKTLELVNAGRIARRSGYCELPTSLFVDRVDVNMAPLPAVAFYIPNDDGTFRLLRRADQPFSPLALSTFSSVWVDEKDFPVMREYAEKILTDPAVTNAISTDTKMATLRRSAMLVVEDLFNDPSPENIDRSQKVVGSFVYVLMKDPKAYLHLAKLSSHDPYTLQHSVGTAVHCIILARKTGITNEKDLMEIGTAGLLHDIGKVRVKKEIINKQGPLEEHEWEEMRTHSLQGYEIVKNNPSLTDRTKRAILEHHEDRNGTGYPNSKKWDEIHLFSKIVAICDTFNALTTNRSYSKARTPFEALQFMREKLSHKVDEELYRQLVLIYGGQVT